MEFLLGQVKKYFFFLPDSCSARKPFFDLPWLSLLYVIVVLSQIGNLLSFKTVSSALGRYIGQDGGHETDLKEKKWKIC